MNLSYVLYFTFFLASLALALNFINILDSPNIAKSDIAQLVCDICFIYENPESQIVKFYYFKGNTIEIHNDVIVLDRPFWVFPSCGRQIGNKIYLPVSVDSSLKVSGVTCLKLEYEETKVSVSKCSFGG